MRVWNSKPAKAVVAAVSVIMLTAASACSSEDPASPIMTPEMTGGVIEAPAAPAIPEIPMTEISAVPEAAKILEEAGKVASEEWYVGTLRAADIISDKQTLLELRTMVCEMLEVQAAAQNLLRRIAGEGYSDPTQQGVIIAASMTSSCPDTSIALPTDAVEDGGGG